jgi:hypothetical protein
MLPLRSCAQFRLSRSKASDESIAVAIFVES